MWPALGLQERRSPASTAWDDTPMPAVFKYASQKRNIQTVQEEQMRKNPPMLT